MLRIFLRSFTHNNRLIIAIVVFLFAVFATVCLIRSKSTFSHDSYGAWILKDWLATNQNSKIIILGDSQLG
ncbi:MAG: hypothetical protein K2X93_27545, partial [Candidatus Obscuribacterales bacterium]|nr:hypothetical protein [Candidatus Obscuribacterales bacterium]